MNVGVTLRFALVLGICAGVAPRAEALEMALPSRQREAALAPSRSDSVLEARTSAVASELRCPVCQGLSIQDSPSELSQQMRDVVKEQLRAGRRPDEVLAFFVARYGEWILLRPAPKGFNLLVYVLPVLVVAGGAAMLASVLRRWTRHPPAAP